MVLFTCLFFIYIALSELASQPRSQQIPCGVGWDSPRAPPPPQLSAGGLRARQPARCGVGMEDFVLSYRIAFNMGGRGPRAKDEMVFFNRLSVILVGMCPKIVTAVLHIEIVRVSSD